MIRNIVFDMGGVLVDYQPLEACRAYSQNEEDAVRIYTELFRSEEWALLDAGAISEEEILRAVCARLPKRLWESCGAAFAHWPDFMPVKREVCAFAAQLAQNGYKLWLCSNAGVRFSTYCHQIPVFAHFEGLLVSAFERCVKPDPAIYQRLFEKFGLAPSSCFFIDDLPVNVEGARACGMDGHVFDGSLDKLEEALAARGVKLPAVF